MIDKNDQTASIKSRSGEKHLQSKPPKSKWEISKFQSYYKLTIGYSNSIKKVMVGEHGLTIRKGNETNSGVCLPIHYSRGWNLRLVNEKSVKNIL